MEEVVIAKEVKLPRSYEVIDAVLQHGDAVDLARLLSCAIVSVQQNSKGHKHHIFAVS